MIFHLKILQSWIKSHQVFFQIPKLIPRMIISKIMGWGCKILSKDNTKLMNINRFHETTNQVKTSKAKINQGYRAE